MANDEKCDPMKPTIGPVEARKVALAVSVNKYHRYSFFIIYYICSFLTCGVVSQMQVCDLVVDAVSGTKKLAVEIVSNLETSNKKLAYLEKCMIALEKKAELSGEPEK